MNAEQLQAIKALAEAATPGPWEPSHNVDAPANDDWSDKNDKREGRGEGPNHVGTYRDVWAKAVPDAAFIAAARTAVPQLVAEVERLTAERDALAAQWSAEHDAAVRADEQAKMARPEVAGSKEQLTQQEVEA